MTVCGKSVVMNGLFLYNGMKNTALGEVFTLSILAANRSLFPIIANQENAPLQEIKIRRSTLQGKMLNTD
jgi:hypothetical protein